MNPRIDELAEIAKERALSTFCYYDHQRQQIERTIFAELIILECCKEIRQEPFNAGAASSWLKKHFRIAEYDE